MSRTSFLKGILAGLLALSFTACAGAECSKGKDYCEGNVAWECVGGGDQGALKWETSTCGDGTTCMNGVCFAERLIACPPERVGTWGCAYPSPYPGQCTEAGYWAWDLSRKCDDLAGFTCKAVEVGETASRAWVATCVQTDSTCPPNNPNPVHVCSNDILTACTLFGMQGLLQDCAAEGKVCSNGECSAIR